MIKYPFNSDKVLFLEWTLDLKDLILSDVEYNYASAEISIVAY